ncbi:hypothetical protein [Egbenema bharatensis]|uniref:hypothetical protein n=1 Tax=Egbenema bharatensis TaxID=3463334 RepID=UPI003A878BDE
MNKASYQLQEALGNGWSIQIYSRDRRLLCSLDPSHGWMFLIGVVLGFIIALVSLSGQVSAQSLPTASSSSFSAPITAPLSLD